MQLDLLSVVERAWMTPFMTKSDYARDNADLVAAAACHGLIPAGTQKPRWHQASPWCGGEARAGYPVAKRSRRHDGATDRQEVGRGAGRRGEVPGGALRLPRSSLTNIAG